MGPSYGPPQTKWMLELKITSVFKRVRAKRYLFVICCFLIVCFVFGGPGGGLCGFLLSSRSSGFATTFTTNGKAAKITTRTTQTSKNNEKQNETQNEKQNEKHRLCRPQIFTPFSGAMLRFGQGARACVGRWRTDGLALRPAPYAKNLIVVKLYRFFEYFGFWTFWFSHGLISKILV